MTYQIATWNGWVGQRPAAYAGGVERILSKHFPDLLTTQETNRRGTLKAVRSVAREHGYRVVLQRGLGREGKSTTLLVKRTLDQRKRNGLVVATPWVGPMLGLQRRGRTFPSAVVGTGPEKVRTVGVHMPPGQTRNREAFRDCLDALEFKAEKWTEQLVLIGDWNAWWGQRGRLSPHRLAREIGGRTVYAKGSRIDYAIVRGFSSAKYRRYKKLGSDSHRYGVLTLEV